PPRPRPTPRGRGARRGRRGADTAAAASGGTLANPRARPLPGWGSERRPAAGRDLDPRPVDDDRHDPPAARQLQQLGDDLGPRPDVDLAHRGAARRELGALRVAVRATGHGVEQDRRAGAHDEGSLERITVAAALNMPPRP